MTPRLGGRLGGERGVSLIEAALVTPLFLLLTFSIVEFGAVFYAYLSLENGVSVATRYAVTGQTVPGPGGGPAMSRQDSIKVAMRQSTPTLNITDAMFTFSHKAPSAGAGWVGGPGGPSDIEKVTIVYPWRFMTPLLRVFFVGPPAGTLNLRVESSMKNESRFN